MPFQPISNAVKGGAKGATTAATVTSTSTGADHQSLDVCARDANGNVVIAQYDATASGAPWTTEVAINLTKTAAGTPVVPAASGQRVRSITIVNPTNSVTIYYFVYHGAAPTWSGASLVPVNLIAAGQMSANNMTDVFRDNQGGLLVPNGVTVVVSTVSGAIANLNYTAPTSNIFATVRYGV